MPKITDKVRDFRKSTPDKSFFSFEYFPPKTPEGVVNLCARMDKMAAAGPLWIDVTWGAGGSTAETTFELCENALDCTGVDVLMHLTCTNCTAEYTRDVLTRCKAKGLQNILALRGDPPAGLGTDGKAWTATEGGFSHAADLVRFIRKEFGDYFCIGVAAYPEGHLDNEDKVADFRHFKEKVDAGADFAVTQLFYDCKLYFKFVQQCRDAGIPESFDVYPGLMPIQNYAGFKRMTGFCKTFIPQEILDKLEPLQNDDAAVKAYGIELGVQMGRELLEGGAPSVHVYTLNLETTAMAIVNKLGLIDNSKANKSYAWRRSQGTRGDQEDVRPIFWAQRARSYIERTSTWDDFPNGRFGNRDSPAYGLFAAPPKASKKVLEERMVQWKFNDMDGLKQVFADFLTPSTGIRSVPWCSDCPGDETVCIRNQLVKLCQSGLLTINSQPRVNGTLSTDPLFGWGPSNGVVYQKAYVEFFCSPEMLEIVLDGLQQPSIEYMAVRKNGDIRTNASGSENRVTAVTWGVFPGQEIQQPTVVDKDSFMAWKDEAYALWDDWTAALAEDNKTGRKIISDCKNNWYLVNVVDNDFLSGDLFLNLGELVGSKIKSFKSFLPTSRQRLSSDH